MQDDPSSRVSLHCTSERPPTMGAALTVCRARMLGARYVCSRGPPTRPWDLCVHEGTRRVATMKSQHTVYNPADATIKRGSCKPVRPSLTYSCILFQRCLPPPISELRRLAPEDGGLLQNFIQHTCTLYTPRA